MPLKHGKRIMKVTGIALKKEDDSFQIKILKFRSEHFYQKLESDQLKQQQQKLLLDSNKVDRINETY